MEGECSRLAAYTLCGSRTGLISYRIDLFTGAVENVLEIGVFLSSSDSRGVSLCVCLAHLAYDCGVFRTEFFISI
jgi:hypothetical protein